MISICITNYLLNKFLGFLGNFVAIIQASTCVNNFFIFYFTGHEFSHYFTTHLFMF